MRRLLIGLLVLGVEIAFGGEAPSLQHAGTAFLPADFEIAWSVPTNQQPKPLWVYKNVPQDFSDKAISNLMALGSFTVREKRKLPSEIMAADKDALHFRTKDETRYLTILPSRGWIEYADNSADDVTKPIKGVPDDSTAQELALKLLNQIGISADELATKPNSSELLTFQEVRRLGHFDKKQGKRVEEVNSRGIFFIRQIDGIHFAGIGVAGGFFVRFTSNAKVAELRLVWRNLQPYTKYEVASPDRIIRWIKEGKAVMPAPNVSPSEIRKLTINQISPLYMGALGDEPQDFTYPFASLNAVADLGQTNVNVQLYCPIIDEAKAGKP
jgi:hypothetical protein